VSLRAFYEQLDKLGFKEAAWERYAPGPLCSLSNFSSEMQENFLKIDREYYSNSQGQQMLKKYIKDTIIYWVKEYKLSGIKIENMASFDVDFINDIEASLTEINKDIFIYGDGNYKDELIELSEGNENLEFLGLRPNAEIVKRQLSATLLVNPRPTHQEFVKYSFPSKTMECMASGTPLLTTRLPGMPKEYYDYVKFIDEETEDGILSALSETLTLTEEELFSFGKAAKEFVMKEKTNDVQAKKLLKFIKENY